MPAPTFTAGPVCTALGIAHGTLNSWAHSGFFERLDAATTTKGKARRFTLRDLAWLSVWTLALDLGIGTARARFYADATVAFMSRATRQEAAHRVRFAIGGPSDEILLDDAEPSSQPTAEFTIYPFALMEKARDRLRAPNRAPNDEPPPEGEGSRFLTD